MSDRLFGHLDLPAAKRAVRDTLGLRPLAESAPHLFRGEPPADILLYKAWKDVLGKYPSYPAQKIGDCTSFGNGHAHDLLECVEAATEGVVYSETCTEALYGVGRELGGMQRGGDGCTCGYVVQGMLEVGLVKRADVGDYSGTRARQWGRSGIPDDVRRLAGKCKLGSAALATSGDAVIAALAAGNPVPIASNCGFEGRGGFRRDANGICYAGGSWPHNMAIVGRISSDGTDTFVIAQSWGDDDPEGPQPFDLPAFCYRALRSEVERYMIPAQDCYAISKTPGFGRKPLPSHWTQGGFA